MKQSRPAIFRGRHFEPEIIATCVRWYLRFSLSLRNVEEMMAERGLLVDHTTVWRWCQKYGPMIYHRLRGKLKYTTTTWHMDETYVRIAGRWVFIPCGGQSRRHRGLLFVGNARSRSGHNVSDEGVVESGSSNSTSLVHG